MAVTDLIEQAVAQTEKTLAAIAQEQRDALVWQWQMCRCRSFPLPHQLSRHLELRSDYDWRTKEERRGVVYRRERIK